MKKQAYLISYKNLEEGNGHSSFSSFLKELELNITKRNFVVLCVCVCFVLFCSVLQKEFLKIIIYKCNLLLWIFVFISNKTSKRKKKKHCSVKKIERDTFPWLQNQAYSHTSCRTSTWFLCWNLLKVEIYLLVLT